MGHVVEGGLPRPGGQRRAWRLGGHIGRCDWQHGCGRSDLSLAQSDWAAGLPPGLTCDWHVQHLKAGGEFWATLDKGLPSAAVARVNAPQVRAGYAERTPVDIADLGVGLYFQRSGEQWRLRVADLAATLAGKRWGETEAELVHEAAGETHWQGRADRIDLGPLLPLLDGLAPMPDKALAWFDGLKPQGVLHNFNLDYWPERQGPDRLRYATNLEKVGVSAYHDVPAVANVDGTYSGNLGGGQLDASAKDFMLHLASLFPEPWHYRTAHARLFWQWDDQAFTLGSHLMQVEGDVGRVAGDMLIRLMHDHDQESYMDLRVGLSNGDGRFTSQYLPTVLPEMSKDLAHWLGTAIKGGHVDQGYFHWQGSLKKGAPPEAHAMSLYFKVRNGELDYQPGWPALSQTDGEVFVEDKGVHITAERGRILDSQVSNVTVDIPTVAHGEVSHLRIDGDVDSSLADGLKILREAPIGAEQTFAGWEGAGDLKGHLNLDVPLAKGQGDKTRVIVDFATDGARLKIAQPALELNQVTGKFRYDTDSGLSAPSVVAQALGTRVSGSIRAEGRGGLARTRVLVGGQMPVKTLLQWAGIQRPVPVSGSLPYQLNLLLDGKDSQLQVTSDLKGAEIDLPAPFGKAANESRASEWRMTLEGPERRYWATYDALASLAYAAPSAKPMAGRGVLRLGGDPALLPNWLGLQVRGKIDNVDADAWQAVMKKYAGSDVQGAAGLLRGADLQIGHFHGFGVDLDNLKVDLLRADNTWQLALDSALVSGRVSLPDSKTQPIQVSLDRLDLPKSAASDLADSASAAPDPLEQVDPRSLPALNVSIRQLLQGGKRIGAWNFNVRPTTTGASFNDLDLDLRGLKINGQMSWDGPVGATRTSFRGRLEGANLADVLKAWDFAPSATSERFRLDVDGQWPGSPAYVSLRRFGGTLNADMRKGQFVEVEGSAQALRVFGLLNFNAINRRLRLDFSDLLGKGLSYDRVRGVLGAQTGVYLTREPLKLEGPSSNLELNGTLDLAHDQIDAKLLVTLPVTNNLPLAALIVGAPAIGGALFVVDKLLGDKVARFASVQYTVKGSWQNPTIAFDKPFEKPQ
ncbi:MAG: hypothetical protein GAK45_00683 [Pseudomonas citronellolis]|nr:MAG: hypothetical protein GAK45_00683 [Pseudomonas citronellolis]